MRVVVAVLGLVALTSCSSTPAKAAAPSTSQSAAAYSSSVNFQTDVSSDSTTDDFIEFADLAATAMGGCTPGTVVTCKDQIDDGRFVVGAFGASKYITDPKFSTAAEAVTTANTAYSSWLEAGCSQTFTDDCSFSYTLVNNSLSLMGASIKTATS